MLPGNIFISLLPQVASLPVFSCLCFCSGQAPRKSPGEVASGSAHFRFLPWSASHSSPSIRPFAPLGVFQVLEAPGAGESEMRSLASAKQLDLNLHFLFCASSGDRLQLLDHHGEPGTGLGDTEAPPRTPGARVDDRHINRISKADAELQCEGSAPGGLPTSHLELPQPIFQPKPGTVFKPEIWSCSCHPFPSPAPWDEFLTGTDGASVTPACCLHSLPPRPSPSPRCTLLGLPASSTWEVLHSTFHSMHPPELGSHEILSEKPP